MVAKHTSLSLLLSTVGFALSAPTLSLSSLSSSPSSARPAPSVTIQDGTVVGFTNNSVDNFRGIPFAQPPIGELRLRPPQPLNSSFGTLVLPKLENACIQQKTTHPNLTGLAEPAVKFFENGLHLASGPYSEDCLTINVQRPAAGTVPDGQKLPVLFWIFGGGFEQGSTQTFDASSIIATSVQMGTPIMYVAVNYRLNAFGFLQGNELSAEGSTNLGLRDQRLGLEWVAENIEAFGGDPARVTIWGESAGSVSVFQHLLINDGDNTYKGKALFHAAIMDSGSLLLTLPATSSKAQAVFDGVVSAAGCNVTNNSALECLRSLTTDEFSAAMDAQPDFLGYYGSDLAYLPRQDPSSCFFSTAPDQALLEGKFAKVPVISGDQEDEGTIFANVAKNISNTDQLVDYFSSWFTEAPRKVVAGWVDTYPNNAAAGAPFGTGDANEASPQFKRLAAMNGDYTFTMARRFSLQTLAQYVPSWSYLATYLQGFPDLGTYHTSDVGEIYGLTPVEFAGKTFQTYYINFVNYLNPNGVANNCKTSIGNSKYWPRYIAGQDKMINISATEVTGKVDDFRDASYQYYVSYRNQLRL